MDAEKTLEAMTAFLKTTANGHTTVWEKGTTPPPDWFIDAREAYVAGCQDGEIFLANRLLEGLK